MFTLYGRGGIAGSSSFEHVIVGEIKDHGEQQVSGFHNWLQAAAESSAKSNYVAHEHRLYCRHHHSQLFKQKGNFSHMATQQHANGVANGVAAAHEVADGIVNGVTENTEAST